MKPRSFPVFTVTKKAALAAKAGHPWVYAEEIVTSSPCENGALVDVTEQNGTYLGTGFFSERSKIAVRILSNNANETFGEDFWRRRVSYAVDYRLRVMRGDDFSSCRLIFGEADGFPGLTVDRFENVLCAQVLSFGTEKIKELVYSLLVEKLSSHGVKIDGIYERNDSEIRSLEGLDTYKGWFGLSHPESPVVTIKENGVKYLVDVENSQKTGFFLDQKFNRRAVASLCRDLRVLDCFTHTGSFALNAVMGGAKRVTAVDVSQTAVGLAKQNAALNGFEDRMDFVCADVFDLLPSLVKRGGSDYDFIILDPPAFTKSRQTSEGAARGYKEINYRAMRLLPRGGYLATCSCSHFMFRDRFERLLNEAARDAGVSLRQIEARQQACDHPILTNVPETDYLKFYIFQVV
ncbi:MAG: class I SAM-dependent rRNA methyltransferase [Clostridia bacterium]|nr:class I SAM-dependent rRNA methyltransferase [Clostridia bacterium]